MSSLIVCLFFHFASILLKITFYIFFFFSFPFLFLFSCAKRSGGWWINNGNLWKHRTNQSLVGEIGQCKPLFYCQIWGLGSTTVLIYLSGLVVLVMLCCLRYFVILRFIFLLMIAFFPCIGSNSAARWLDVQITRLLEHI